MFKEVKEHARRHGASVYQIGAVFKIEFKTCFNDSSQLYLHSSHGLRRICSMIDMHAQGLAEAKEEYLADSCDED